mmetsp:Transcript_14182/g.16603  ORF Transcript_14182/g.16603 Transcript_14182/m.16603 type:complete len:299 (-) Transcript_14182:1332-2228(-)
MHSCFLSIRHRAKIGINQIRGFAIDSPNNNKDVYTHGHSESVVRQHAARTAYNSAAYFLPFLKKGSTVLDVGCGPGSITADFASIVGPAGHVTAIDVAPGIIEEARKQTEACSNVTVEQADVYSLPYPDNSFDHAHAHQVLQHLSDPLSAMKEMKRVVKPGGYVACRDADYETMVGSPDTETFTKWKSVYQATCRKNNAEPNAGRFLYQWARMTGTEPSDIHYSNEVVLYSHEDDDFREKWGRAWSERSINSEFGRQAVEYGIASQEEMESISEGWRDWANNKDGVFYYVNGQVLIKV